MQSKECRWCVYYNQGNCSKVKKEFESDNNLINLVEDGYLTEYLRETVGDELKPYLNKKTFEEDSEEIIQMFVDVVYSFFLDRLESSFKIPYDSEFYCKYWR